MKQKYADRPCPIWKAAIPGKEQYCPECGTKNGRVNKNKEFPGPYKGYVKENR